MLQLTAFVHCTAGALFPSASRAIERTHTEPRGRRAAVAAYVSRLVSDLSIQLETMEQSDIDPVGQPKQAETEIRTHGSEGETTHATGIPTELAGRPLPATLISRAGAAMGRMLQSTAQSRLQLGCQPMRCNDARQRCSWPAPGPTSGEWYPQSFQ